MARRRKKTRRACIRVSKRTVCGPIVKKGRRRRRKSRK